MIEDAADLSDFLGREFAQFGLGDQAIGKQSGENENQDCRAEFEKLVSPLALFGKTIVDVPDVCRVHGGGDHVFQSGTDRVALPPVGFVKDFASNSFLCARPGTFSPCELSGSSLERILIL
jgi:hypothetical protein